MDILTVPRYGENRNSGHNRITYYSHVINQWKDLDAAEVVNT